MLHQPNPKNRRGFFFVLLAVTLLLVWSTISHWRHPLTIGQRLADALRQSDQAHLLHPAIPLLPSHPGTDSIDGIQLTLLGQSWRIPRDASSVLIDGTRTLPLQITADNSLPWTLDPAQSRVVPLADPEQPALTLTLWGSQVRIPRTAHQVIITGPPQPQATLLLHITSPSLTAIITAADTFPLRAADDPPAQSLLTAINAISSGDNLPLVRTTRANLLAQTDRALLDEVLSADISLLKRAEDLPSAARLALPLLAWDPTGVAVDLPTATGSAVIVTLQQDGGTLTTRLLGFDSGGRFIWSATLRVPPGSPDGWALRAATHLANGL